MKTYVVTPHSTASAVLMRGHKTSFYREIQKIIPKLTLLPFLIWRPVVVITLNIRATLTNYHKNSKKIVANVFKNNDDYIQSVQSS